MATQVRIRLSTSSPDVALPEDPGPILVSTDLRRFQLSTLVNRLLTTDSPVPFDFLVNGQFLRTSIDEYLTANGISAETVLHLEYLRALVPPAHVASLQHDDWVSSVDLSSAILSSSYDGLLRTWDNGTCIATSASAAQGGHTGAIKDAKFFGKQQVVSAGLDRTVRVWNYNKDTFTPVLELYGHTASVDRLAVDVASSRILSASADGTINMWSPSKSGPAAPENLIPAPSTKRRKLSAPNSSVSMPARGPLATLSGHGAQVSDVVFKPSDATVAYSTSWDHTLKTWDLATGSCVQTRTTAHALLSVSALPIGLIATGTAARHVTLVDPRASASNVVAMTLRGHANAVVALSPSPDNEHVVASGSHDGTVRVWDVRSVKAAESTEGPVGQAMFVLERDGSKSSSAAGEGTKVFGLAWDQTWGIVSAGEDKCVQINRQQ